MRFLLWLLVPVFAVRALAASSVTIAPPAAWVDPSPSPVLAPTPAADAAYGYDFLHLDHQVNVRESESYVQSVYRISSEGALQSGARFTWSFDPAYETLVLHHLRVIRDGVAQERLREGMIQIIQQESDLDRHMLNGRLTALVILEDVRVGDVIDYASSRRGANPVFGGRYIETFTTGWSVPVRHQRIRVVAPAERPLIHKEQGVSVLKLHTARTSRDVIRTWEGRDLPVISSEDQLPSWYAPYPFLQLAEFKSWADVAAWAVPLYAVPDPLPAAVAEKEAELTRGVSGDEARTMALLKFVQQEIRYLGLELGPGTHRPNPPDQVLARRFGDCKDKALLFCTLMRAAGMEAYPALVNTSYRDRIGDWAASPFAFDHVIACVPRGSALWWVDPTLNYQEGGALYRGLPDYRRALPVRYGTEELAIVTRPDTALRHIEINEQFDVVGFDEPARFKVVTRYSGLGAESMRGYLATTAVDEITRDYVNYYAASYPGLTSTKPVSWTDEPAGNTVTVEENYSVPGLWKKENEGKLRKAEFYPQTISDYASQPTTRVRTMPLRISHPVTVLLTTRVNLHEDWKVTPVENTVTDHAFRITDKITGKGPVVTMSYRWESLDDHVPPGKIGSHVATIERVRGQLGYNLTHNGAAAAAPAPAVAPERFRFNWLPVVVILLVAAGVFYAARRLYALPALSPPPMPGPHEGGLVGLGGWLVLIGFGVILRPVILITQLVRGFGYAFNLDTWETLTTPGAAAYQAMYAPVIIAEVAGNTVMIGFSFLLMLLFFKRKRAFPAVFIGLMLFSLFLIGADTWAVKSLLKSDEVSTDDGALEIVKVAIQCAIWIPYMLHSRRVKLTFTR